RRQLGFGTWVLGALHENAVQKLFSRFAPVGQNEFGVDFPNLPQALAAPASAVGIVKTEIAGLQLGIDDAAIRASKSRMVETVFPVLSPELADNHGTVALLEGGSDRLRQARPDAVAQHQAIHHELNGVRLLGIEPRRVTNFQENAVDPGAKKTGLPQVLECLFMLTLLATYHRRQYPHLVFFAQGHGFAHDLRQGMPANRRPTLVAVWCAQACVQEP